MKNHLHVFAWKVKQGPLFGETPFSVVPPTNSLVSVSDSWRAIWADTTPFKGPMPTSWESGERAWYWVNDQTCAHPGYSTCTICFEVVDNASLVVRSHFLEFHPSILKKCPLCDKRFFDQKGKESHISYYHKQRLQCDQCDRYILLVLRITLCDTGHHPLPIVV